MATVWYSYNSLALPWTCRDPATQHTDYSPTMQWWLLLPVFSGVRCTLMETMARVYWIELHAGGYHYQWVVNWFILWWQIFAMRLKFVRPGAWSVGDYTLSVYTNNDTSMQIPTGQFVWVRVWNFWFRTIHIYTLWSIDTKFSIDSKDYYWKWTLGMML